MEQLGTLLNKEDFCKQFAACPDKESAIQLFADNGVVLTEDEVKMLALQISSIAKKLMENDGALSEEDLEQIAGGASAKDIVSGSLLGAALFAAIGTFLCPGVGSAIGAAIGLSLGGTMAVCG